MQQTPPNDSGEQRKARRRHLIFNLEVTDEESGKVLGRLADLTKDGIMVVAREPLPTDRLYRLRITVPEGLRDLSFEARSRWSAQDANADYFDTGFQLLEVEPGHADIVHRLITTYGFAD